MCLEHCWNVMTIYGMRGEGSIQELAWGAGEGVAGSQNEQSYQWYSAGMCLETNAMQFFPYSPGHKTWPKLKTFVSNMKRHGVTNAEKDGASFIREDQRTHQSNRNRGNCRSRTCKAMGMDSWAGSLCQRQQGREGECGMVAEHLWTTSVILLGFSPRDSEEQDWMSGVVPGSPFPTLHCSYDVLIFYDTSMLYQSKHVQQKERKLLYNYRRHVYQHLENSRVFFIFGKKREFQLKWVQRNSTKVMRKLRVTNEKILLDLGLFI